MKVVESTLMTARGRFGIRSVEPVHAPGDPLRRPTVLCVHGFPDDAATFDTLAFGLAQRGHPVVSMYLRGYAPSTTRGPFSLDGLAEDLASVAGVVGGGEPVHLVGHDYGSQLGFAALVQHPGAFRSALLLSGAHPDAINRNTRRHPRQLWLSRYIVFFQLGAAADRAVSRGRFAYLDRLWDRWSPGTVPDGDHRARVKQTIAASMPAPIAMYRGGGFSIGERPISVPILFIAGSDDRCTLPEMSLDQEHWIRGEYRREVWPGVGHYPHLERPRLALERAADWFGAR